MDRKKEIEQLCGVPIKLDQDVKNISGTTLSCRHITDGVKRLLALYDVALR